MLRDVDPYLPRIDIGFPGLSALVEPPGNQRATWGDVDPCLSATDLGFPGCYASTGFPGCSILVACPGDPRSMPPQGFPGFLTLVGGGVMEPKVGYLDGDEL